jgi:hypothetical protein
MMENSDDNSPLPAANLPEPIREKIAAIDSALGEYDALEEHHRQSLLRIGNDRAAKTAVREAILSTAAVFMRNAAEPAVSENMLPPTCVSYVPHVFMRDAAEPPMSEYKYISPPTRVNYVPPAPLTPRATEHGHRQRRNIRGEVWNYMMLVETASVSQICDAIKAPPVSVEAALTYHNVHGNLVRIKKPDGFF